MKLKNDVLCICCRRNKPGVDFELPAAASPQRLALGHPAICLECLSLATEIAGGVVTQAEYDKQIEALRQRGVELGAAKQDLDAVRRELGHLPEKVEGLENALAEARSALAGEKANASRREERLRYYERGELPPVDLERLATETLSGALS